MSDMMEHLDEELPEMPAWKKGLIFGTVLAVLIALAAWGVSSMSSGGGAPKRQTVKIAVLPDTPPPPPPKPEKPPEPEKQDIKPQPQQEAPKPEQAPPEPQQLKMDGPAGDGPSAFASGQVSQEYKGGDIGTGGGGNRLQFAFFTNRLTRHIQAELARNRDLKGQDYRISVRVWLSDGGQLQRVELASSSGSDATDDLLRQALTRVSSLDQIPSNLPQPLSLRITNRVTG